MPETIRHDGLEYIEIAAAARFTRLRKALIEAEIAAERVRWLALEGRLYISLSSANRLKREQSTILSARRKNKTLGHPPKTPAYRPGAAKQDVLPMSSGRAGSGWKGQRER